MAFIRAKFIIVSSGHDHGHPTAAAAQRYLDFGVDIDCMFRCDLGEDDVDEWTHGRIDGNSDGDGDDSIDILIRPDGAVLVEYQGED